MITPEQSRAARAILAWKQSDLAKAADVSVTAVNYFEREIGAARSDTIASLQEALEQAGIEFIASGGLRRKHDAFQFLNYRGNDFIARLNDDMYRALYKGGAAIATCSADETAWNRYGITSNKEYLAFAKSKRIRERILIVEGARYVNNPDVSYRTLPEKLIGKVTYTIYADRIAYLVWPQKRVVILRNSDLSSILQAQFNFLWEQAKAFAAVPPTEKLVQ